MDTNEPMIAIAFDLNFRHAAELFSGISDYVNETRLGWRLMPLNFGFEERLVELANSSLLTGAIGTFVSDNWLEQLISKGVAAVNMFNFSEIKHIPSIGPNDKAMGKLAAEHLLAQRVVRFAFLGTDNTYQNRLRAHGFKNALPQAAIYNELTINPLLAEQIQQLTSKRDLLGIFCCNDRSARECILIARKKGLQCGRDFLIVGVDDDPSESVFAGTGISSFKQPIKEIGYKAAQTLHGLLTKKPLSGANILDTPARLIVRESSMFLPSNHANIAQRAVNFLRENLADPQMEIISVAETLGVSRRVLEIACKKQLGTSPYKLLTKARLKLAQDILKTTRLAVMEVGIRCGYPEPHHFSAWFKKQTGTSPKAFRDSFNNEKLSGA